jgi:Transposase zinc-binding domain
MGTRPDPGHGSGQQVEVADILRLYGDAYQRRHRLAGGQRRVLQDLRACRTAALGGQMAQCDHWGAQVIR